MTRLFLYLVLLGSWLAMAGCVDRYTPDVPPAAQANLVVDGFINPQGSSVIKLGRTFSVNTKNTAPAETRATVAIQDDAGRRYPLVESPAGTYTSAVLALDAGRQYQLRITTAQGRAYASDLVPLQATPPIDKISWQAQNDGVQLYVSAHDDRNATHYYRWEYEETWQFTSAFESSMEYAASPDTLVQRPGKHQIFTCWRTEASTNIRLGTSAQLSQDALVDYPLVFVPPSPKIRVGYSILVRQYAQTPAEYTYWETIRKNTENLGTVNDPLPARVTGNVHALDDASEPVLGFVGAHSVTEKRLFISAAKELPIPQPNAVFFDPIYAYCGRPESLALSFALAQAKAGLSIPLQPVFDMRGKLVGATVSSPACVDCRLRGTNVKPSYWP